MATPDHTWLVEFVAREESGSPAFALTLDRRHDHLGIEACPDGRGFEVCFLFEAPDMGSAALVAFSRWSLLVDACDLPPWPATAMRLERCDLDPVDAHIHSADDLLTPSARPGPRGRWRDDDRDRPQED